MWLWGLSSCVRVWKREIYIYTVICWCNDCITTSCAVHDCVYIYREREIAQIDYIIHMHMISKKLSPVCFLISPSPNHWYIKDKVWSNCRFCSDLLSPYPIVLWDPAIFLIRLSPEYSISISFLFRFNIQNALTSRFSYLNMLNPRKWWMFLIYMSKWKMRDGAY